MKLRLLGQWAGQDSKLFDVDFVGGISTTDCSEREKSLMAGSGFKTEWVIEPCPECEKRKKHDSSDNKKR
jgi:hypothetical protein